MVIQVAGDGNHIELGLPGLYLTRYVQRRDLRRDDSGELSAADLVTAYARSVELMGRGADRAALQSWMDNGRPISVRVLTGSAGRGKTRLALELCEDAAARGWRAGFVTAPVLRRFQAQNLATWRWDKPTLIVADYAASDAENLHEWLVELADHEALGDAVVGHAQPLRLLLLERQADVSGGWWRTAFGDGGGDALAVQRLLDPPRPVALPVIARAEDRRAIIAGILEAAGSAVRPPEAGQSPDFDRRLAALSWGGEPLFLMMAGLLAAKVGFGAVLALSRDDLAFDIARHEIDRIARIARRHGISREFLEHMAAVLTVSAGLDREEALAAIERERKVTLEESASAAAVYRALSDALSRDPTTLEPVQPDIVGEALLLRVWRDAHGVEPVLRASAARPRQVAEVVIRTCQNFAIHGHATPLAWLDGLGAEAARDLPALLALLDDLPADTVELRERAAALAETAVDALRPIAAAEIDAKPILASALNNLSGRLDALGRREAALAASEEAVALRRALAAARPDALNPDLAIALNNLSNRLDALGRREAALAAIEEAVALRRALAAARPDAFNPDLAAALNNLSNILYALGRREAALAASEEAVALYRALAADRPDAFSPDLAIALNNLSSCLDALGRREAALAASEEAVALRRALAAARPDAFNPSLAIALNNLSNWLAALGRREAALAASEEAVALNRALAAARPDAFNPDLAGALNNLSLGLDALGRREAALAASEEAVALRRALAAARPDAFNPDLAQACGSHGKNLLGLGHHEAAATSFAEGLRAIGPMLLALPDAFAGLTIALLRLYFQALDATGAEPDAELLTPILAKLEEIGANKLGDKAD